MLKWITPIKPMIHDGMNIWMKPNFLGKASKKFQTMRHSGQDKSGRWVLHLAASSQDGNASIFQSVSQRDVERLKIGYQEQRSEWFKAFAPFSNGDAQQLGLLGLVF